VSVEGARFAPGDRVAYRQPIAGVDVEAEILAVVPRGQDAIVLAGQRWDAITMNKRVKMTSFPRCSRDRYLIYVNAGNVAEIYTPLVTRFDKVATPVPAEEARHAP
jgi:hypothetical protein